MRPAPKLRRTLAPGQNGIALATALVLLVVITLIGLAAVRGTTVQQRMTANFYDREIGFQNAEAALRAGEALLSDPSASLLDGTDFRDCQGGNGTGPVCRANPFTDPNLNAALIKTVAKVNGTAGFFSAGANATGQPQFVIELICGADSPTPCGSDDGDAVACQSANCQSYGTENQAQAAFEYYRITARSGNPGTDAEGRAVVTLQAMFQVPLAAE